jgi:outer membrane protein assembly factor BamB
MSNVSRTVHLLVASALLLFAGRGFADDWPQWRGQNRDGISKETGLLKQWPKDGPKLLWQIKNLGGGYATPSVVGGRIYLMNNNGVEDEFVTTLDTKDGSKLWSTQVGKVGNPNQQPNYPAARSTPTLDGTSLYALGSDGDLVCLETANGHLRWKKNVRTDFAGMPGLWAYSESPLVDGDVVVCTPGGTKATVVALNKDSGEVVWKSAVPGGDPAGYASIVVVDVDGAKQYVAYTAGGVIGLDAKTGKFLWRYAKTKGEFGMSIITPVADNGLVYSGAGRVGGGAVKLASNMGAVTSKEVYFDANLPTAIGGAVLVDNYLYGAGARNLVCADFKTGKIKWSDRSIAPASLCYADARLYLHGENGAIALIEATPDAYREQGRFTPPDQPERINAMEKAWCYPVIADGRLYIRDTQCLWCYDIKDSASGK